MQSGMNMKCLCYIFNSTLGNKYAAYRLISYIFLLETGPQLVAEHDQEIGFGVEHQDAIQQHANAQPQRQSLPLV